MALSKGDKVYVIDGNHSVSKVMGEIKKLDSPLQIVEVIFKDDPEMDGWYSFQRLVLA